MWKARRFVPRFPRAEGDGGKPQAEIFARNLREWFSTGFLTPVISTALFGFHALRLCWKEAKSLRLASCMWRAALVSLSLFATAFKVSMVSSGLR
jgi:hypothetical protein